MYSFGNINTPATPLKKVETGQQKTRKVEKCSKNTLNTSRDDVIIGDQRSILKGSVGHQKGWSEDPTHPTL